jgi:uncharacterized membrane protein HdeD (DUF308 family)
MKTSTLDTLIWVLIYGGLVLAGLGLSVQRTHYLLGTVVLVMGAIVTLAGFALIYVRSRRQDDPPPKDNITP